MNFQTIKEKIQNAIQNIKSKFSKDSSNETKSNNTYSDNLNTNEDGMMSIDDYFSPDSSKSATSYSSENKTDKTAESTIKKGLEAAKSFINDTNYNPFADQEEIKDVDRKEFKENWFKILIKILITILMIFLAALSALMIYKLGYGLLHNTDISSISGYSDFMVREDNLAPAINENDLIIVKQQEYYEEGDIILYEYAGTSHKIGRVADIIRGYYIITDKNIKAGDYNSKIAENLVIGKEYKTIKNFKGMYDFITSPIAIVLVVGVIAAYFYLMSKGKIKDDKGLI